MLLTADIELMLTTSPVNGRKALLQFPAGDSARVTALMKEVRKAVAVSSELCTCPTPNITDAVSSVPSPFSHAWLALYPEVEGEVAPSPTTQGRSTGSCHVCQWLMYSQKQ